jgi:ABC-type Mn2+/Zn2+ transport system ATPase subunit
VIPDAVGPVIAVDDLSFSYDARPVLHGLSFRLAPGARCIVRGPNGCGKSTFLRLLAGVLRPAAGIVEVLGARVGAPGWPAVAARVGWCGQEIARTDLPLSVREVVGFGAIPRRLWGAARRKVVAESLAAVGSPHLLHRAYGELSAGERQRVALARCLCQAADLLVLDEPLASLDPEGGVAIMELVERLGTPVVLVTHVESHYERPGWRVLAMRGGALHDAA